MEISTYIEIIIYALKLKLLSFQDEFLAGILCAVELSFQTLQAFDTIRLCIQQLYLAISTGCVEKIAQTPRKFFKCETLTI